MAIYLIYFILNLPGLSVGVAIFAHVMQEDQRREMDFYLFYTTKGMLFIYSSVQPFSTYFTQDDPKETGISKVNRVS